jgi:hypothetical protein
MAILKTIQTDYGVPAEYWNIGAVQEDFKGQGTEVTLYGYATAEARRLNLQPLSAGKVQLTGADYIAGADRATLYSIIKQRPEFENCIDA